MFLNLFLFSLAFIFKQHTFFSLSFYFALSHHRPIIPPPLFCCCHIIVVFSVISICSMRVLLHHVCSSLFIFHVVDLFVCLFVFCACLTCLPPLHSCQRYKAGKDEWVRIIDRMKNNHFDRGREFIMCITSLMLCSEQHISNPK